MKHNWDALHSTRLHLFHNLYALADVAQHRSVTLDSDQVSSLQLYSSRTCFVVITYHLYGGSFLEASAMDKGAGLVGA